MPKMLSNERPTSQDVWRSVKNISPMCKP